MLYNLSAPCGALIQIQLLCADEDWACADLARPRASTCVPVRHFDDGIWIDNKCIPSGWTVADDVIVVSDALSGGCGQMPASPPERPYSFGYIEAQAALQAVKRAHAQPEECTYNLH